MAKKQTITVHGIDAYGEPVTETFDWTPTPRWRNWLFLVRWHLWTRWRIAYHLRRYGCARW